MIWRGFDTDATGIQSEPRLLGIDIKCSTNMESLRRAIRYITFF